MLCFDASYLFSMRSYLFSRFIYRKFRYSLDGDILDRSKQEALSAFWFFRLLYGPVQRNDGIENRYHVSFVVLSAFSALLLVFSKKKYLKNDKEEIDKK